MNVISESYENFLKKIKALEGRTINLSKEKARYLSVIEKLRLAMVKNPHLKVMFASGFYDLATPYYATDFIINRLDLGAELQVNMTHRYYMGGHMMYHNQASQKKLQTDVEVFIQAAFPGKDD